MDPNKSHWLDRCNAELSLGILNVSRRSWKPLQTYSRGRRVQDSLTHYSTKILMYSSRICLSQVVQEFSKKNAEVSAVTSNSATASPAGDAVPVTEAVLDGNDVPVALTEDASLSCQKTTPSRPMIKMLSCLFLLGSDGWSLAIGCSRCVHVLPMTSLWVKRCADLQGTKDGSCHRHNISGVIKLSIFIHFACVYFIILFWNDMYLLHEKFIVWTSDDFL